jgi:nitrate reductase gamma subunit
MEYIPHIAAYAGIGVFVVACIARILMWSRMPMHVRWEIYPVAHEPGRAHYGGSYLEEVDWWKKPRPTSLWGELRVMVPEMLFLVALKEHNPKMWWRSFPFHFGIYLVIAATVAMMAGGVLGAVVPEALAGSLGRLLQGAIMVCALAGLGLGLLGALALLHRRLTDAELRDYTAPADFFNLVFFVVAFGLSLAHIVLVDPTLARTAAFVGGLVTLAPAPLGGPTTEIVLTSATVIVLALLVAYIPLTHMSHFIGKYFSYHAIRWNDAPNLKGGPEEAPITELLKQPVTWSAPHINGQGRKSWLDLATEEMKK